VRSERTGCLPARLDGAENLDTSSNDRKKKMPALSSNMNVNASKDRKGPPEPSVQTHSRGANPQDTTTPAVFTCPARSHEHPLKTSSPNWQPAASESSPRKQQSAALNAERAAKCGPERPT